MKTTLSKIMYFILFISALTGAFYVYRKVGQKECRKKKEFAERFVNSSFQGTITQYKSVPRGILLWLGDEYVTLGMNGTLLEGKISINDSIEKQKGEDVFIIYKKDSANAIVNQVVIGTGAKAIHNGMKCE